MDNPVPFAAVTSFSDALLCSPAVYTWRLTQTGTLLWTNCPYPGFQAIFAQTGCLAYLVDYAREHRAPLILSGQLGILWCAVIGENEMHFPIIHVLGPVFNSEVSPELLEKTVKRYFGTYFELDDFIGKMRTIPVVSSILFFQYGLMLHYLVTGERLTRSDLQFQASAKDGGGKGKGVRENADRRRTWRLEQNLLRMVREGDLNYSSALSQANQVSNGIRVVTGNSVNQAILSATTFVSLCTRAAIEGGLSPDTAYTVGDAYIQSLVECRTISDVRTVNHSMYEDFIQRVHRQRQQEQRSTHVRSCLEYIDMHPEEDLSLSLLANRVGYTPQYLSRKFKQETGENINRYIQQTRVDRAKVLLETTDLPVAEIAQQLRFCSTSYFAAVFSRIAGKLPQAYRLEKQKL